MKFETSESENHPPQSDAAVERTGNNNELNSISLLSESPRITVEKILPIGFPSLDLISEDDFDGSFMQNDKTNSYSSLEAKAPILPILPIGPLTPQDDMQGDAAKVRKLFSWG